MRDFLLVCAVSTMITLAAQAQPTAMSNLDDQRTLVVKIKSQPLDRGAETATGFYVGSDGTNAYFATALHPLRKKAGVDDDFDPVGEVSLWFRSSAVPISATVLGRYNASDDLAVVLTPMTNLPTPLGVLVIGEPTGELPIHIIGHPGAGDWSSWTGMVENEQVAGSDPHLFTTNTNASISYGYSGGPVLDSKGTLIGMHLASEANYTRNLRASEIATWLKTWNVPMKNQVKALSKLSPELLAKSVSWGLQVPMEVFNRNFASKTTTPNFLWLDLPDDTLSHVRAAEYRMNHETFSGGIKTTYEKSHHLLVKFSAWGCVNDSTVTVELDDGQLMAANFDECKAYHLYIPEQQ